MVIMSEQQFRGMTNGDLQRSAELARRNIEALKKQAPTLAASTKRPRGKRGGHRNLNPTSRATVIHRLDGSTQFVKQAPAQSLLPE